MHGSALISSSQICVEALNTMHSLWRETQTGYCALPGFVKGKLAALCEVGQVYEGVTSWLCQQNDVVS